MATTVSFLAGENTVINNLAGSGLGFYGDGGFGFAVQIGSYQGRTFITNANGTAQGPEVDNIKFTHAQSGVYGQVGSGYNLKEIPNYLSTLNIRLTNDTSITTQNSRVYIYDRVNKNNNPSGVTCKIAEIIHPWQTILPSGSGNSSWLTAAGSGSYLTLGNSPGISGFNPGSSPWHDWYVALTATPVSVGSKTQFGLWFETEFL